MRVEDLARAVVEPVLSRGAAVPRLQLVPLIVELRIRSSDPIHDLVFNPARHTCQDVDQAVRVRGNEIDWRIARAEPVHRCGDGQPPAACVAREPEVAAAYEAKHDAAFVALDRREVASKLSPHASCRRRQSSGDAPAACLASSSERSTSCSKRCSLFHSIWNATSVGTRSSMSDVDAISTASVLSPSWYQRRRRAGALTASHDRMSASSTALNPCGLWPMITRRQWLIAVGRRRTV